MAKSARSGQPQAEAKAAAAVGQSSDQTAHRDMMVSSTPPTPSSPQRSLVASIFNIKTIGALQLTLLAAISSPLSQLNLSPVYGSIPSSIYHSYGLSASFFLAFALRDKLPVWTTKVLSTWSFWIPTTQYILFHFSSTLGPIYGPLITETLTYYPLFVLSTYTALRLYSTTNSPPQTSLQEAGPAMSLYVLFTITRRAATVWLSRYIGSNVIFTRINLQLLISLLYLMTLPTSYITPSIPTVLFTLALNPHTALLRPTSELNSTLSTHHVYTLLDRRESLTGYISVLDSTKDHFRILRCDHSILGGHWLLPPRPNPQPPRLVSEPIYAIFTQLESIRLVMPSPTPSSSPSTPQQQQKALFIGLGIGTAPSAFIMHGINTTILELDPVIHDFAVRYFKLPTNHSYLIGDAVAAVAAWTASDTTDTSAGRHDTKAGLYEFIVHDGFTGGVVPSQLFTMEFLQGLRTLLRDDGVVAINYAGDLKLGSTSVVYRTVTSVFGSCRVFREEEKEDKAKKEEAEVEGGYAGGKKDADFTNLLFICVKPRDVVITFRDEVEADWLGSSARKEYMMPKYEVLAEEVEREGEVLTTANLGLMKRWERESAVGHWRVMRGVVPARVWELW